MSLLLQQEKSFLCRYMQNSRGNRCTQECDRKWEFKISFFFGKIMQQYERMCMILVCISRKMILLMLLYVCQHTEGIGDALVGLSARRWGWWCLCLSTDGGYSWCFYLFISIQMILVLPPSFYEQSIADSYGRYTAHLTFGNSDMGGLLNPMFCTEKLGTKGYQLLISSTKNWTHTPQWNRGTNPTCFLLRHS